jgi:AcrR family transcriptional regulator
VAGRTADKAADDAAGGQRRTAARDRVIVKRARNTRTRSGAVLSADLIVDAATSLVNEHGAAALSVRRLGAALGCDPTAVYRYFANMDALMMAVADRLIGKALASYRPRAGWKENLRSLARCTYEAYLAYPRVAIVVASRVTGGEHERRVIDLVLGELRAAGFDGEQAVRLYRNFGDFVLAFSAIDADYLARPTQEREADLRRWHDVYGAADPAKYPHLAALGPIVVEHATMSAFESGLTLLLDAFERLAPGKAELATSPPPPHRPTWCAVST